jgi:hypothetical protein
MVCPAFGRTVEIVKMSWDEVRWDEHVQVVTVCWYDLPQGWGLAVDQPSNGTSARFQLSGSVCVCKFQE